MQSKKINELGTNVAPSVNDLTVVGDAATGQLKKITLSQISSLFGSTGSVSSVAMSVPTGLSVTGSPITTSGTLAVTFTAGYSIPTTAKQTDWDTAFTDRNKWDGGTSGLNAATARTSLGLVIGTDVLAYRTFGSAANNNTGDFATAAQGTNADTAYNLRLTGASAPLSISGNIISIAQASTSISGFLSSTDWNTFNGKQQALNGTGFVKASGTLITYDNSTYLTTSAAASTYLTISNASSTYLPLAGGTLTGALGGTTASFSGNLSTSGIVIGRTSNGQAFGVGNGVDSDLGIFVQTNNIAFVNSGASSGFSFVIGGTTRLSIVSSGAATFSGLVTNYNVYNTQTASYTLVLADASKIVEMNVGSPNTVTVPTNASVAFPIGTEITIMQYGGGVTTIASAGGVTINSKDNARIIANRYTGATLVKRGTDEWYLIGNIVV